MKVEENDGMYVPGFLLLVIVVLFAGPVFEFLPSMSWRGGPVANAMVWHDRQRIEQVALLMIVAVGGVTVWRDGLINTLTGLPRMVRWALGLGFALGAMSVGLSQFPRFAGLEWATFFLLLSGAFLMAERARLGGDSFDKWAVRLVVLVAGVIALRIMMGYLAAMVQGIRLDSITLFTSAFSNRRVFGQVACMVIPLLAYPLLAGGGTRVWRLGVFALLAVWWVLVVVSGTRGAWMGLALAAIVLAVFAGRPGLMWLRAQAAVLGVVALLLLLLFALLPTLVGQNAVLENRLSSLDLLSGRGDLWMTAWGQIQAHPLLGIGPMHLAAIPDKIGAHPHNAVLQLAAEWGVVAAMALLWSVFFGLQRLVARLRYESSPDPLLGCLTASLLAAGAQSMVDGVIVMPYTQTWLMLVLGWTMGVYFRDVALITAAVSISRARVMVSMLCLLALASLVYGVFPEVLYRVEETKAFLDAGNSSIPPRYWTVGRIP